MGTAPGAIERARSRQRAVTATMAGGIGIEAPRGDNRRLDPLTGNKQRSRSVIVPPWYQEPRAAVDCLLRTPPRAQDLSQMPARSLAACPAISTRKSIGDRRNTTAPWTPAFRHWRCRQSLATQEAAVTSPGTDCGSGLKQWSRWFSACWWCCPQAPVRISRRRVPDATGRRLLPTLERHAE